MLSKQKGKEEAAAPPLPDMFRYDSSKSGFRLAVALRAHLRWKESCPTWNSQLEEASGSNSVKCVGSLSQMIELDSEELVESILPERQRGEDDATLEFMFSQASNIHPNGVDCWAAIPKKWMRWFESTETDIKVYPHLISTLLECQDSATLRRRRHCAYATARLAQLVVLTFDPFREQLSSTLPPLHLLKSIFKKHTRPDLKRVCCGLQRPTNQFFFELLALIVYAELTVDDCPILSTFCCGAGYYALRIICDTMHADRLRVCAISESYMNAVQEYFTELAHLDTPFFPIIKKQLNQWKRIYVYYIDQCRPETQVQYEILSKEARRFFEREDDSLEFIVQPYFQHQKRQQQLQNIESLSEEASVGEKTEPKIAISSLSVITRSSEKKRKRQQATRRTTACRKSSRK